jgi:pimeloyl-ACP methyl ester carboxylesterase
MGSLAAQLALVAGAAEVRAAVLVSPVVRLRDTIDALSAVHGMTYSWSAESSEFAARADFVARAGEVAGTPVLVITGEHDLRDAFLTPAEAYVSQLHRLGTTAEHAVVPGMRHALADEPGIEPAPQTAHAAEVDRLATAWFAAHLVEPASPLPRRNALT